MVTDIAVIKSLTRDPSESALTSEGSQLVSIMIISNICFSIFPSVISQKS